jgi:hypothetical protein
MPQVGKKKFPYTKKGKKDAKKEANKKGKKVVKKYNVGGMASEDLNMRADDGGSIKGPMDPNRAKVLEKMKESNKAGGEAIKDRAKKAKDAKDKSMGLKDLISKAANKTPANNTMTPNNTMTQKPMVKAKAGGKIKGYAKGGKVRGAGIAKKGVKKCKMR